MTKASNNLAYADTLRALYAMEAAFCRVLPAFIAGHLANAPAALSAETIRPLKEHVIDSRWQKQLLKACLGLIDEEVPETCFATPAPSSLRTIYDLLALKRAEVEAYTALLPVLKAAEAHPEIINACDEILEQEQAMVDYLSGLDIGAIQPRQPGRPSAADAVYHA